MLGPSEGVIVAGAAVCRAFLGDVIRAFLGFEDARGGRVCPGGVAWRCVVEITLF